MPTPPAAPDLTSWSGDLNLTSWSLAFGDMLERGALHDSRGGFGVQATWQARWNSLLRIPIDHILLGRGVRAVHREVGPFFGSDHLPILADVVLPVDQRKETRDTLRFQVLSVQHYLRFMERDLSPRLTKLFEELDRSDPPKAAALRREIEERVGRYFENNVLQQDYLMTRAVKV